MTTLTIRSGRDTGVNEATPNYALGKIARPRLANAVAGQERRLLVQMWAGGVTGLVVKSASLSVPLVTNGFASGSRNVSVWMLGDGFASNHETWNGQAATTGSPIVTSVGPTAEGERMVLDVTDHLVAIAAGQTNRGFRIATASGDVRVAGFEWGTDSWELTVEVTEELDAPDSLSPQGRTGTGLPTLSWVLGDSSIVELEQSALQVQIDPAQDEVSPDFDSGEVTSLLPQYDLSTSAYPSLAGGATTFWRVRALVDGEWSDWSDWAEWTRTVKPGITVTSPTGGSIFDPSPVVEFGVDSGTMEFYRMLVTPDGKPTTILYDSGDLDAGGAASVARTIPAKWRGSTVFAEPQDYRIVFRVTDVEDRVPTPGDPEYVEKVVTVSYDDDVSAPVTGVWATQMGSTPTVRVRWTRGAAADGWAILRDGKVIARLDHDDPFGEYGAVTIDPAGGWSWVDRTASPWVVHTYTVKALTATGDPSGAWSQSTDGGWAATEGVEIRSAWLLRENGEGVALDGEGFSAARMVDRRARFSPIGSAHDVHVLSQYEGLAQESVETSYSLEDQPNARRILRDIKDNPTEPVRLMFGDTNVPVIVYDLTPDTPAETWQPGQRIYAVSLSFFQVGEFKHTVGR